MAAKPSTERLFFALWPDDAVRARIAGNAARLQGGSNPAARMVAAARYHLTLQFIGTYAPLPSALVEKAIAAGDAQDAGAFELVLDRFGSFGHDRVAWAGPSRVPGALAALVEGLGRSLLACNTIASATPGSFVPHVTLGRQLAVPKAAAIEPVPWTVGAFSLFASGGADVGYRSLAQWSLRSLHRRPPR
jgi:2'-5' RNA ligase